MDTATKIANPFRGGNTVKNFLHPLWEEDPLFMEVPDVEVNPPTPEPELPPPAPTQEQETTMPTPDDAQRKRAGRRRAIRRARQSGRRSTLLTNPAGTARLGG